MHSRDQQIFRAIASQEDSRKLASLRRVLIGIHRRCLAEGKPGLLTSRHDSANEPQPSKVLTALGMVPLFVILYAMIDAFCKAL